MAKLEEHFYNPELFPINQDRGEGFEFEYDGSTYVTQGRRDSSYPGFRVAELTISSFQGFGGIHYYGKLSAYLSNNAKSNPNHSIGGSLRGVNFPADANSFDVEVIRPVNQSEIDEDPIRWEDYKAGIDSTNAFYTEEEIIEIVETLKDEIFKGKWILMVDGYNTDNKKIIIDN